MKELIKQLLELPYTYEQVPGVYPGSDTVSSYVYYKAEDLLPILKRLENANTSDS